MSRKGLFQSLVSPFMCPDGVSVAYPGKPYYQGPEVVIKPSTEPVELDMVFMAYTSLHRPNNPLLEFIKEIGAVEQRRNAHDDVQPVVEEFTLDEEEPEVPSEDVEEIEAPATEAPDLDELPDRTQEDANAELQEIAFELDPVRKSVGFSTLREKTTTIKDIHQFITEKRNLHAVLSDNSQNMPRKNEWISIALHGYTDEADKDRFQYSTRKWAKKWYTKKVLEDLFTRKGVKFDVRKKVAELFDEAWDAGWLKRDPADITDGVEI